MFAGEVYSDLVLLWLVVHASRFVPREAERPETCWLEQWTREAEQQGARALGELRGGVERALRILGRGITSHPRNAALRERLRTGALPPDGFHGQLLRVVYRLIFLFVAEDRTLDGHPCSIRATTPTARGRHARRTPRTTARHGCGISRGASRARAMATSGASSGCWPMRFRASPTSRPRAGAWRFRRWAASSGAGSPRPS